MVHRVHEPTTAISPSTWSHPMQTHRSNLLDYVEDDATEIDHGPHWSSRRVSLGFMPPPVQRSAAPLLPAPLPLPLRTGAVGTPAIGAPLVASPAASPVASPAASPVASPAASPVASPAASFVMRSHAVGAPATGASHVSHPAIAMRAPLPPPLRAPTGFYSYAEDNARQQQLDTERVAPLSMSDLESPWLTHLHGAWQRFAAPALGMIAALILVVGYLAYSSQSGGNATSAALAPTLTMPVVVAPIVTEDSFNLPVDAPAASPRIPTVPEAAEAPAPRATSKRMSPKKRISTSSTSSTASKGKRRPVRIDTSTPLGNLRPSRF